MNATYVSRVLRLALLAPEIVEAILDGRQSAELQLDYLLDGFALDWDGQWKSLLCKGTTVEVTLSGMAACAGETTGATPRRSMAERSIRPGRTITN